MRQECGPALTIIAALKGPIGDAAALSRSNAVTKSVEAANGAIVSRNDRTPHEQTQQTNQPVMCGREKAAFGYVNLNPLAARCTKRTRALATTNTTQSRECTAPSVQMPPAQLMRAVMASAEPWSGLEDRTRTAPMIPPKQA